MNYLIIGAGGTGGCLGARLQIAGQDVTWIARGRHLTKMKESGLIFRTGDQGDICLNPVKAYTMEEYEASLLTQKSQTIQKSRPAQEPWLAQEAGPDGGLPAPDVVFVCVKYYSLQESIPFLQRICGAHTVVIPLLNVFGTGGQLQESLPDHDVLDGCIYIYGKIEEPGIVAQPSSIFRVYYGYRPEQTRREEAVLAQVEQDLKKAGIEGHFTETIQADALMKFSYVSPVGAAGLYYQALAEDFKKPGLQQDFLKELIREVEALGEAMGIHFSEDPVERNLEILRGLDDKADTSMQRDVAAGKESEFQGLVYRVVELAEQYKVACPAYRKVCRWAQEQEEKAAKVGKTEETAKADEMERIVENDGTEQAEKTGETGIS